MRQLRRLILWDIDGTLVSAGPAARTAFDAAVAAVVGRHPEDHGVQMSGKTDPEIALEILGSLAITGSEARRHLPGVLRALERQLEGAVDRMRRDGRILPGVVEVLERLDGHPDVLQSVLTGNLAATALVKLRLFGLEPWMDLEVGAYGSDHHDRAELVPVALGKVRDRHGQRLEPDQVWIVGDTPRDLAAARAGGARCVLVATGPTPLDDLSRLGADAALADLTDTAAVIHLLAGPD